MSKTEYSVKKPLIIKNCSMIMIKYENDKVPNKYVSQVDLTQTLKRL